ncbi:SGNH/GDSL hydrolase family protein [Kutzneria sp. 744]|uniref:SGNH/GDSL hydrolase family protein n=1 Tax=Kutzneria sp. (strain 744) TaxID=345341 RepID=UPI0003EEABD4|nr:SGNH/GDSL hydrolase family protein [Kutzneria sp. 744]EWM16791.1 lipolytic enzyme, G-D-S-L [Kutzneria sp. 744]
MRRYVALGDSLTEGIGDFADDGRPRGWADRFAHGLAARRGEVEYANLAVRGLTASQVLATQVGPAVDLAPDLVSVIVGMNDLLRPRFDVGTLRRDLGAIYGGLAATGAVVFTATLPEPGIGVPLPARMRASFVRRGRRLNDAVRQAAAEHGVRCLDLARSTPTDPAIWSSDKLHPSAYGHQLIADEFLAFLHGQPSAADSSEHEKVSAVRPADQVRWVAGQVGPWLWRRLTSRPAGEGVTAKLPAYQLLRA